MALDIGITISWDPDLAGEVELDPANDILYCLKIRYAATNQMAECLVNLRATVYRNRVRAGIACLACGGI